MIKSILYVRTFYFMFSGIMILFIFSILGIFCIGFPYIYL